MRACHDRPVTKRGWLWAVIGGLLPVAAVYGSATFPPARNERLWSHPLTPPVFLGASIVLAVAHVLIVFAFDDVADRSGGGPARSLAQVAGLGTVLLAIAELASGALGSAERGGEALSQLAAGFVLAAALVVIGTFGAGAMLLRSWTRVAIPLLVSAVILLCAVAPSVAWSVAGHGVHLRSAALTAWGVSFVWLGVALKRRDA